jgi:hypothetical protein
MDSLTHPYHNKQAFLKIGFSLKSRQVIVHGGSEGGEEQTTEYTHVILPADLPIKYILKTILVTIQPSVATTRSMNRVDSDGSESPLPPKPSSPLPTPTAAGGLGSSASYASDLRSSPPIVATGSLSSSRSYNALAASDSLGSSASYGTIPSSLSSTSWSSSLSQPVPTVSPNRYMGPQSKSADFDVASLLREIDDFGPGEEARRESCGLCKELFLAAQMLRIANKSFCSPCHQRVTALAKQRDVKLE